jgi:chromosome segregation ATPase
MQSTCLSIAFLACLLVSSASAGRAKENPLGKVIELLDSLSSKITAEGEAEAKAYKEYFDWCEDVTRNKKFEIETAKAEIEKLEATIAKASSNEETSGSKIDELAASIASGESDLKDATLIRQKEAADFSASEAELADAIDTLDRAIRILDREMQKNPAALMQVDSTSLTSVLSSLGVVMDAAAFAISDKQKLLALVQSQQASDADDADVGAPAAAVYKTHSSNIVEVLENMKEKAEGQLSDLRTAETNAQHNYNMLKQSLEDQSADDKKDMDEEKASKAEAAETKSVAQGDLANTQKDLADGERTLAAAQNNCIQVSEDHQATVASRKVELQTIAEAKKILQESTGGAVGQTYSFLQVSSVSRMQTRADLANAEVVNLIKKLAEREHSSSLAQLASRISTVMRYGALGGDDVFAKVKGLIREMIDRLVAEAGAEASEKAFCDEETAKTTAKKSELQDDIARLTAKIDQATSRSTRLKDEVKELQAELAALAKMQAEMDATRQEENAAFAQAKADLEQGLQGVRQALDVLREYYAAKEGGEAMLQQPEPPRPEVHTRAEGAGGSIIGILEVVESDFAKNLAEEETQEADAQSEYDKTTQANKITKAMKEQDVKYKTEEHTGLDKAIADLSSDRQTAGNELSAVLEYLGKLNERCIAKPETYEERKRRREAEIAGLKQALAILDGEAAFLQRGLRGAH